MTNAATSLYSRARSCLMLRETAPAHSSFTFLKIFGII
nr:MAG TPA: hypothetical protein [Caudoviricetes sp.]